MKWTDEEIDKLFQENAAKESFSYEPEYWDDFNASLSASIPLSEASDEAFDEAFRENATQIAVDYKEEFWQEFSESLPVMVATEDVTDAEVDALYREEAAQLSFEYKPNYWEEMAAMLRQRRRRPDFIWFGFSGIFAVLIAVMLFTDQSPLGSLNISAEIDSVVAETFSGTLASESNDKTTAQTATNPINVDEQSVNNDKQVKSTNVDPQTGMNANGLPKTVWDRSLPSLNEETNAQNKRVDNEAVVANNSIRAEQHFVPGNLEPLAVTAISGHVAETLTASFHEIPKLPKYRGGMISGMYIQGIGGVSQSSITPSDAISNSFGVGLGWQANKGNWTFNVGSNVLVENFSDLNLTRSAKVYGFGADFFQFDLFYKRLYTAELELFAGYNIGRHQVRIGVRPSYTFSSLVDVSEKSMSNMQGEMIESNEQRTSVYGFMEGIQQWGVKPSIGYAYNFPADWTLGVNIGTELLPSINEEFISGVNNTLPLDGQLYIRKTLNFRK